MTLANMHANGVRALIPTCEACGHEADVPVGRLPRMYLFRKQVDVSDAVRAKGNESILSR